MLNTSENVYNKTKEVKSKNKQYKKTYFSIKDYQSKIDENEYNTMYEDDYDERR